MRYRSGPEDGTPKVVSGEVEVFNEGVNILGNGQRVGHGERRAAMKHILDVKDRGYITDQEAEARLKAAQAAEKQTELNSLTTDLPAPFYQPGYFQAWDWEQTKYYVPTLLTGVGFSTILAIVPTAALVQDHLFPHNPIALVLGIITMLLGTLGFFACIGGLITKGT
jgi:hypothetical protein